MAPEEPYVGLGLSSIFFVALVIILFRNQIFRFKKKSSHVEVVSEETSNGEADNSTNQD